MTRDDAARKIEHAMVSRRGHKGVWPAERWEFALDLADGLEVLGLIKFDEPKPSVQDEVCRELQTVAVKIVRDNVAVVGTLTLNSTINLIEAIERAGLKIVRAP